MTMAMKPALSNRKSRKEQLSKGNSNISGGKNGKHSNQTHKNITQNDKENNPNIVNISRQLFNSK